jgi:hypothetical protein
MAKRNGITVRGTSNNRVSGSAEARRRRKVWLVETYRADVDIPSDPAHQAALLPVDGVPLGQGTPACRCYRCGDLLTVATVTADRIVPGCVKTKKYPKGGTYVRENLRPSCQNCASLTGGLLRAAAAKAAHKKRSK